MEETPPSSERSRVQYLDWARKQREDLKRLRSTYCEVATIEMNRRDLRQVLCLAGGVNVEG